jgi:hypothetical protein
MFTESSLNVHWMFTECSLNIHTMLTKCSLNVYSMFTECSLNARWIFTQCSDSMFTGLQAPVSNRKHLLNVHWMFTEYSLNVPRGCHLWNQPTHWMFTECSLNVHWMFTTECSLNVHWIFTQCSLNAHSMLTQCLLVCRHRWSIASTCWMFTEGVTFETNQPTECSLNVHWRRRLSLEPANPLNFHRLFALCSLNVHWMFTECWLDVHWMFTECSLTVDWMCTECSPNVHWIFPDDITFEPKQPTPLNWPHTYTDRTVGPYTHVHLMFPSYY